MHIISVGNNKFVRKNFRDAAEARKFTELYNSFPSHVLCQQNGNSVLYPYVDGKTLEDYVLTRKDQSKELMVRLANLIGPFHFENVTVVDNYDLICKTRNHYPSPEDFLSSKGYISRIHGDLHLRNILVSNTNEIVFIDRLQDTGDLLFDFSFILSLICFYLHFRKIYFKELAYIFLDCYLKFVIEPKNFVVSFRNNFLNYGYYAFKTRGSVIPHFWEWEYGIQISEGLANYANILDYLESI